MFISNFRLWCIWKPISIFVFDENQKLKNGQKHPVLIPFSLDLRDITQETKYVMNFDPCDLCVPWRIWLKFSIGENRFVFGTLVEIQSLIRWVKSSWLWNQHPAGVGTLPPCSDRLLSKRRWRLWMVVKFTLSERALLQFRTLTRYTISSWSHCRNIAELVF